MSGQKLAAECIASLRADLTAAKPRFPWLAADLQTLRNTLVTPHIDMSVYGEQVIPIRFRDGDETLCYAHAAIPGPTSTPAPAGDAAAFHKDCSIIIIHGLGGDARGSAVRYLTARLLASGFPVVSINLRGAPEVYHLASSIGHAGKTADLYDILSGLQASLGRRRWGLIGISLGGNLTAKALGDGALSDFDIVAAMTICAPLDMQAASDRILEPRNWLYEKYLLRDLKNAVLRTAMGEAWKAKARGARTVYQFDDTVTGPFHGYGTAANYYGRVSAGPVLKKISIPTLLLAAANDPWIPAESFNPYASAANAPAQILVTPHGGHVGYHFTGTKEPAYCSVAARWFTAVTS